MRVESKDEVGLVLAQHTEHPLGIRLCDGQADLGKAPLKVDEIVVEIPGADRARHRKMQLAGHVFRVMQVIHQLFLRRKHITGVAQHPASLLRQHNAVVKPVEQRRAKLLFELFDLRGHGGLGIAEFLPGGGKTGVFAHSDKRPKYIEIHSASPFV